MWESGAWRVYGLRAEDRTQMSAEALLSSTYLKLEIVFAAATGTRTENVPDYALVFPKHLPGGGWMCGGCRQISTPRAYG